MHYLTNYYRNLSEQLAEQLATLQKLLEATVEAKLNDEEKKNQRMNAANAKAKNNFGALSNQIVAPNHMSNTLGKRGIVVATGGSNSESALDNGLDPVNPDITNP